MRPKHLIFACVLTVIDGVPSANAANCPSGGTSIFFGNGIHTDKASALRSLITLKQKLLLRLSTTGNSLDASCLSFNLAYDAQFIDSSNNTLDTANTLAQIVDAGIQKGVELSPDVMWGWLNAISPPPDWFSTLVTDTVTRAVRSNSINLHLHEMWYRAELNAGNTVIVLAHSQGNLYVNEAYILLLSPSNFSVVALATPANHVATGGPWFTLYNDVIALVPGHLSENISNDPPSPCLTGDSVGCHSFDGSYLLGHNSSSSLLDAVIWAIPFSRPGLASVTAQATLDGITWPASGSANLKYLIGDPQGTIIGLGVPSITSGLPAGEYKFTYQSDSPPNSTLAGIQPCLFPSPNPAVCNQTVAVYQTFVFNMAFTSLPPTGRFTMTSNGQTATEDQILHLTASTGGTANVNFSGTRSTAFNTNTVVNWKWTIDGVVTSNANGNPFLRTFGVGLHAVSLVVTDNRGMRSASATGTVFVSGLVTSMQVPRYAHTATLLNNGLVLVVGGQTLGTDGIERPTASCELYDPQSGTWRLTGMGQVTQLSNGRSFHVATRLGDGRVLIAGGGFLSSEIFDPATETFSTVRPMSDSHSTGAAVLLSDGRRVLVAGGAGQGPVSTAEIYDSATNLWSVSNSDLDSRAEATLVLLSDGRVLFPGGGSKQRVDLFDPATNTWRVMNPLLFPRWTNTATVLPNGTVLVAGGNNGFAANNSAEIYDVNGSGGNGSSVLVSEAFTPGGWANSAVSLPNGDVYLAGGYGFSTLSCSTSTANVQLFNASTGHLVNEPSLATPRGRVPAIFLPSQGAVVFPGGLDLACGSGTILSSVEIKVP